MREQIPSSEAVLDIKAIVERVMLTPGEDLEGIVLLAVARTSEGEAKCRTVIAPLDERDRLLKILRGYLDGPPGMVEYRREG